ncbi:hydrogenase expression/formation protein HypD [Alkalihalophilus pseudofirmus OF4]|uniref:Hydrogenase expression/formation protein HypD n=1 Tax=Alkalihalophilus pseudofirmus (strain ATCC BAA-2126 / JCM 17055 / OF4) TaxID=398511 RepID=D3FUC9_ALKPO|nr:MULTISPECIES: hydrogenase formation protein HypD [Alkalihalophilus]ADC48331.1 hydrogenase expression/formation protein HypD [Alkalihalophilus pseudofirmus OF4]MED1601167.1 hydrogenase formation protein HypD [Alkalihalophilus marmarensis]
MQQIDAYNEPQLIRSSLAAVINEAELFKQQRGRLPVLMEVCGSHTMAFARSGIKQALKNHVTLIAGPGCPVCVTDQSSIDAMIQLAEMPNSIICTFGDMMRVPGSKQSLMDAKTNGCDVRVIYSPIDSIKIAQENPDKEVILLGIGFETTIPLLALAVREAERKSVDNFSIWMTTKLVKPVLEKLVDSQKLLLDGFLLPGHVSVILGEKHFRFLKEFHLSGVISGFEPVQLLSGIHRLLTLSREQKADVINDYTYVVKENGNTAAKAMMNHYLEYHDEDWRGIGKISNSGLVLKSSYSKYDAKKKFEVVQNQPRKTKCRCGEVIQGLITPEECSLFDKACTPNRPIGPCMVSTEGTCAAHYQYMREG